MIIGYTGIGAKKNGIHTEQEFLDIMNKEFTHKDWNNSISWPAQLQFKDWVLLIFLGLNTLIAYGALSEAIRLIPLSLAIVITTTNQHPYKFSFSIFYSKLFIYANYLVLLYSSSMKVYNLYMGSVSVCLAINALTEQGR